MSPERKKIRREEREESPVPQTKDSESLLLGWLRKKLVLAKKKERCLLTDLSVASGEMQQLQLLLQEEKTDIARKIKLKNTLLEEVQKLKLTRTLSFHETDSETRETEDDLKQKETQENLTTNENNEIDSAETSNIIEEKPVWDLVEHPVLGATRHLFDGHGHVFLMRRERLKRFHCRGMGYRQHKCNAIAIQKYGEFKQMRDHSCKPLPDFKLKLRFNILLKKMALVHKFRLETELVDGIIPELCKLGLLSLVIDMRGFVELLMRFRLPLLPPNPNDLWFDINMDFIPDNFLKGDVIVNLKENKKRHLIFAADRQISLLGIAKRWYLDLTYKFIGYPFLQLVTISAMRENGIRLEQIPLVFVFMSRMTTKDFQCVFEKLLEILEQKVHVETIVCDYQPSLWKAVESSFPYATVTGCGYHWFQDVMRAVKKCGLADLFLENEEVRKVCTRLLCLYLLPSEKIPKIFSILKKKAAKLDLSVESASQLSELFFYVETTWINNPTWPIHIWSMFGEPIRYYFLAERCYIHRIFLVRRFNKNKEFNLYDLIDKLFRVWGRFAKIEDVDLICRERIVDFFLRFKHRFFYPHIKLWESYEWEEINALKLLKMCSLALPFLCLHDYRTGKEILKGILSFFRNVLAWCPDDEKDCSFVADE